VHPDAGEVGAEVRADLAGDAGIDGRSAVLVIDGGGRGVVDRRLGAGRPGRGALGQRMVDRGVAVRDQAALAGGGRDRRCLRISRLLR
jgi:hypothetical protein